MNYDAITFNGTYNSEGNPVFKGERKVENTFDITTLERMVEQGKKQVADIEAAVMSAETNIELNRGIIELIKEGKELADNEISGGKIYFESVKDLKAMKEYLPKVQAEVTAWEETLETTKQITYEPRGDNGETITTESTDTKE